MYGINEYKIVDYIPTVIEASSRGERSFDIFSRLLRERIVFLGSEIDDDVANSIVAQLLLLDSENSEKDIMLYINSPGGVITAGMAIYDTMKLIKAPVSTICLGDACSMGAFLLSGGEKGKRLALPNARIMIHQPLGGARGQATDIEIEAKEILRMKTKEDYKYFERAKIICTKYDIKLMEIKGEDLEKSNNDI